MRAIFFILPDQKANPGAFAPGFAGHMLAYERTDIALSIASFDDAVKRKEKPVVGQFNFHRRT